MYNNQTASANPVKRRAARTTTSPRAIDPRAIDPDKIHRAQVRMLCSNGMRQTDIIAVTGLTKGVVNNIMRSCPRKEPVKTLLEDMRSGKACMFCGAPITQTGKAGRKRKFCCDTCRLEYWKLHRYEKESKPAHHHIQACVYCGRPFDVYGNKPRKYCCHQHYLMHRYGVPISSIMIAGME